MENFSDTPSSIQTLQRKSFEFWTAYKTLPNQKIFTNLISSQEVLNRIEVIFLDLIQQINSTGTIKLSFLSSIKSASFDSLTNTNRLQNPSNISLSSSKELKTIAFIVKVLQISYNLLLTGRKATKREVFYMNSKLFQNQKTSDKAIDYACYILEVPRDRLNIFASSKGLVTGSISFYEQGIFTEVGERTVKIPSDMDSISDLSTKADFILVVEKDTALSRLVQEGFFADASCVGVTGCGYPDLATRQFLRRLTSEFPWLPVLVLTDFDPHGFKILSTYTFGSRKMAFECDYLALPFAHWLGVHNEGSCPLPLTGQDKKLLKSLLRLPQINSPPDSYQHKRFCLWKVQMKEMKKKGVKHEIDNIPDLKRYVLNKVFNENWI
jgi:meiotic recombination protein SPO11